MAPLNAVHILVDLSEMNAHLYTITLNLLDAKKYQQFSLPCWAPGSYLMREFAQHIVAIKAFENNQEIEIRKLQKNIFQAYNTMPHLELRYQVYGFDSSIRAAFIDDTQAFFNGSSLFLCPVGKEKHEFYLTIKDPHTLSSAQWHVASAMPASDIDARGFGSYKAMSYDELIDYPFQISAMKRVSFMVKKIPHEIVLVGDVRAFNEERLRKDVQALCETQIQLFADRAPFDHYLFIARFEEGGHGGLEHRNSAMLLASPYALSCEPGERDVHYRTFLSLCSHEYFHAWNVKRLKPKNFVDYDLNKECYTTMLWLFEGITSYYDDRMLRQAELISAESYLEVIAKNYSRLLRNKGRLSQSLAESSFDAWIKFYRPNENTPNATVSYYLKGSFVALLLDLMIRIETKHQKSLDDVMRLALLKYGQNGDGIDEEEFFNLVSEFGINTDDFKDRYIYGTSELPLAQWLSYFGVELVLSNDEQSIDDKTKLPSYWGLKLRFDDHHRALINFIDKEGPALKAGLSVHDEIVAVNNIRLEHNNMTDLLASCKPNQEVSLISARKKMMRLSYITPTSLPLNLCKMSMKRDIARAEQLARISWLGQ